MFPKSLYPASLFPWSLFPGSGLAVVAPPAPVEFATATARDSDILDDVVARLRASKALDAVYWGELPEERGRPADKSAVALVEPGTWDEIDEWDAPADVMAVHHGTYRLTLIVRNPDARTRDRKLELVATRCQNTLDGQSLAGLTMPGLTKLRRGVYERASNPERRMTITGEYAFLVDGSALHNTNV